MNSKNTIIVAVVVLALIGGIMYVKSSQTKRDAMMEKSETVMEKTQPSQNETMMEKPTDSMEKPDAMMKNEPRYVAYSKTAFDQALGKKRVYFFHAAWCPTCKAANTEISSDLEKIPEDVVLFKTDYDKEIALKRQYAITYQHTFVLVDDAGREVKKWNGGGLAELATNTR